MTHPFIWVHDLKRWLRIALPRPEAYSSRMILAPHMSQ